MAKAATEGAAVIRRAVTAPTKPVIDIPLRIKAEGKVWAAIRIGGFYGYVPSVEDNYPDGKPYMLWEGGRIGKDLWNQMLAFFEWSQKEFKSEVQVRLYYNSVTRKWGVWAFPQAPDGMTTKELPDYPDTAPQRAQFAPPWSLLGTVHHHCTSGAFQSGTDRHNETDQEGIHITVGNIGSEEYSLHGRVQVRKQEYIVDWSHWFEAPEVIHQLPAKLHATVMEGFLKMPPPADTAFPEQWKKNCHKPVRTVTTYSGGSGTGTHRSSVYSGSSGTSRTYMVRTDLRTMFTPSEVSFMHEAVRMMAAANKSHNETDSLIATKLDSLSETDKAYISGIVACAMKFTMTAERVDELFDKWDFATVLHEIDRLTKSDAARALATAHTE